MRSSLYMEIPIPKSNEARSFLVEATQTLLALSVMGSAIYGEFSGLTSDALSNSAFFILGFYFGRPTQLINDRKL